MRFMYVLALLYALSTCGGAEKPQDDQKNQEKGDRTEETTVHFGAKISPKGAISVLDVLSKISSAEGAIDLNLGEDFVVQAIPAKVEGEVVAVCKVAGCWLDLATEDGRTINISTNEEFFVKPDIIGKTVVVEGNAYEVVTSVAERKDSAKDEGLSVEEIAQITASKSEYKFLAKGLVIK